MWEGSVVSNFNFFRAFLRDEPLTISKETGAERLKGISVYKL